MTFYKSFHILLVFFSVPCWTGSEPSNCSLPESGDIEVDGVEDNNLVNLNKEHPECSAVNPVAPDLM